MIKKIRTDDLEVGMFVSDFNTPWLRHPFLGNRRKIRSSRDVDALLRQGVVEVYIDTSRGRDSANALSADEAESALRTRLQSEISMLPDSPDRSGSPPPAPEIPFEQELRRARKIYEEARCVVRDFFDTVRSGGEVDGDAARETVSRMVDSIFRNPDALLSLARLKSFDDYTAHHCLNVAVLALHLGAALGVLQAELLRLGIGAILHDLGKVRVPADLVKKQHGLSGAEFELVKTHVAQGADIILRSPNLPEDAALVALNHHERYDGSGYLRGLRGAAIGKFGLIVTVADVYDAMTSERSYKKRIAPAQAVKRIYEWAGSYFHPVHVRRFIQCVGIYPTGSLVQLDSGETGVVVRQNRGQALRPWIRLCRDHTGRPVPQGTDVDLRAPDASGRKAHSRSVQRVLHPEDRDVDVERVLAQRSARATPRAVAV